MQPHPRTFLLLAALGALLLLGGCTEASALPTADSTPTVETPTPSAQSDETSTDDTTPFSTPESTGDDGASDAGPNGTLEVHVINVGQADATLLRTEEETMLIDSGDWRDDGATVIAYLYHAGHHGSNTSSTDTFLDAVDPQVAVISSAYDSQYGHPHDETLARFADRDVSTTWTGVHGTVVFESDGREIVVRTQHDATTAPLEITEADEATAHPSAPGEVRFIVVGRGVDHDSGADRRLAPPVHPSATAPSAVGVAK